MATRYEQLPPRWNEICAVLAMRLYQFATAAAHSPVSRENFERYKGYAITVVELLEQATGEESFLPALNSLSLYEEHTPPSSPISVSPSSSPRNQRRDIRTSADELRHLPPINTPPDQQYHIQPQVHAYPLSCQPAKRIDGFGVPSQGRDARSEQFGGYSLSTLPAPNDSGFSQFNPTSPPRATFVAHSFDKSTHSQGPDLAIHPNPPNQHVPRHNVTSSNNGSPAIVITQPIATICEVPGFKRRGRPSTRIDNQCVECGTHRTPEWRRGEGGVHLCNACGLQYSKRVRRERAEKKRNAITAILNP